MGRAAGKRADAGADARELAASTASYEAWVDRHTPTSAEARADKHARMAAGAFPFLRATYYRWVCLTPGLEAPPGPVVAAVGDLHVENFGTWRDGEARLVWGVNDLDEADRLPAAFDLLRLATSLEVARLDARLVPGPQDAMDLLLEGYGGALASSGVSSGVSTVLERPDPPAVERLLPRGHAQRWWARLAALPRLGPDDEVPPAARRLLDAAFPRGVGALDLRSRVAGMGSRDHLRFVAIADVGTAPTAREAKAMAPPATWWANGRPAGGPGRRGGTASVLLSSPHRSPDPTLRIRSGWVVRRYAPWSDRIEIVDLRARADVASLVRAMGAEAANLHLATASAADLRPLTAKPGRRWLTAATERMVRLTVAEAATWAASWAASHRPGPEVTAAAPKPDDATPSSRRSGRRSARKVPR